MTEKDNSSWAVDIRNFRSEPYTELKTANREWNDCIAKNFLPQWLNGEKLNIEDVCSEQKARLEEADSALYSESPLPVKMFTLPTAPSM